MPVVRSTSKSECELCLRRPPAQVAEDTTWLLRKMARTGPPDAPPLSRLGSSSLAEATPAGKLPFHEILARETHIAALSADAQVRDMWSGTFERLARVPPNTGAKYRRDIHGRRPTKSEILDAAIAQFPYLVKK